MKFSLGTTQVHLFAPAQPEASPYLNLFEQGLIIKVAEKGQGQTACAEINAEVIVTDFCRRIRIRALPSDESGGSCAQKRRKCGRQRRDNVRN